VADLGTDAITAAEVVVATVGVVLTLVVLVRISGQRSLATMSAVDIACVVAVGAVAGRTTLLAVPSLATGVIALVVLFLLRHVLSGLEQRAVGNRLLARKPVVLIRDGQLLPDAMRRSWISDDDLRQRLRLAGVADREDVRLAILERTGQVSIVRSEHVETWMLADIEER
jgi:uncharacterized membrane protein YcaP (DUF421 family)